MAENDLLFTKELAARLRVSPRTVQNWRQKGLIRPELMTPGGQARWIEADVREQLRVLAERAEQERAERERAEQDRNEQS